MFCASLIFGLCFFLVVLPWEDRVLPRLGLIHAQAVYTGDGMGWAEKCALLFCDTIWESAHTAVGRLILGGD